jgi:hypothetical protein
MDACRQEYASSSWSSKVGIPTASESDSSSQEFQDPSTPVSVVMEVKLLYNTGRFIIKI